jgi:AmmeMemoRadiSam system protein A
MDTAPPEPGDGLDRQQRRTLLALARRSIAHGLEWGGALRVDPVDFDPALRARRASFVTLHEGGQLRGCIGHLEAIQPLVTDVAENAFSAAFRDPRFPPVTSGELDALHIEISVLSPAVPMDFSSEADLLAQIQPGRDGLILEDGPARGTFLPTVWESVPDPADFLRHLRRKAGLPPHHWSEHLRVSRYHTECFGES